MNRRLIPMPRRPGERAAALAVFRFMRKAWGPRASYFLARLRHGPTSESRIGAALFLAVSRVPADGAAPSLSFPGLPFGTVRNVNPRPGPSPVRN